jgi:hypothetical protein
MSQSTNPSLQTQLILKLAIGHNPESILSTFHSYNLGRAIAQAVSRRENKELAPV